MRLQILHLVLCCCLIALTFAWTKEDHEIFKIRDELELSEGNNVTFYDILGVKSSATYDDIQKAFKKKSKALHPDKVKHSFIASRSTGKPKSRKAGDKKPHVSKGPSQREIQAHVQKANERYRQLGLVSNILKSESRERYDHFLKNGFPSWRGTGYYYSRFRPGLGSVLFGLFLVGGGFAHYAVLVTNWNRQRKFVDRLIRRARKDAWGDESGIRGIPGLGDSSTYAPTVSKDENDSSANLTRRQKRENDRQNRRGAKAGKGVKEESVSGPKALQPSGEKRRVVAENGKIFIVDSIGNVFLEEEDDEGETFQSLIDIDEIPKPTWRETAVYRLPVWLYRQVANRFLKDTTPIPSETSQKQAKTTQTSVEILGQPSLDSSQELGESFEIVDASAVEDASVPKIRSRNGKKR